MISHFKLVQPHQCQLTVTLGPLLFIIFNTNCSLLWSYLLWNYFKQTNLKKVTVLWLRGTLFTPCFNFTYISIMVYSVTSDKYSNRFRDTDSRDRTQNVGRKWGMTCNRWHQPETLWFRIGVSVPVILIVIVLPSLKWYETKDLNNKQYLNCSRTYDNHLHYCDVWMNKLKADKSYRLKTWKWSCCSIRTNISHQWITLQ